MNSLHIGAHVDQIDPIAEAAARGADIVQFFLGEPQSWKKPATRYEGGAAALRAAAEEAGIGLYIHAPYIINVASPNNRIRIPSRKLLQQTVTEAAAVGARGVIVHGGHVTADDDPAVGYDNWRKAVDGLNLEVPILIENTAGGNNAMARHLEAIRGVWEAISTSDNLDSVGFCVDTCHAHAGGLDLATLVDDILGITGRIDLVHCNDSRDIAGSGADRHTGLGNGEINRDDIAAVVRGANAPVILETPGDGHVSEIAWLRGL
ncbi:deoxyribonuclease IV [Tessaracoccus antarcticus]|uniref:Deoxyribonuclease IV n=1 Tax=Tessaracoccus antarcticus TaxID=2479848 RepID=A0A3M0GIE2_9ACTN|nr:deoxyribonuclease IV [Tessaracoccus antarcticus]RMB62382.1 deoxyribonuclease IV [Tessaracoccus antarcticus]